MADEALEAAAEQQHAARLSVEQLHDIAEAVETMSSDSPLKHEREDQEALEEEKADKRELLEEAKEASILEGEPPIRRAFRTQDEVGHARGPPGTSRSLSTQVGCRRVCSTRGSLRW